MDFQLCSVNLEERYPRGRSGATTRDMRAGAYGGKTAHAEKEVAGCVAFLWGRTADGASVCVRVEGVRPRLYFALRDGETVAAVRTELEAEIADGMRDTTLECGARTFCHFYGYEPDATTPSGRREHRYVEAAYPSLATWRAAVRLRKHQDFARLRARVGALHDADARARTELRVLAGRASKGDAAARSAHGARAAEQAAGAKVLALLEARLAAQRAEWEDFVNEHGDGAGGTDGAGAVRDAHEWFVDPTTRFLQELGVAPSEWLAVASPRYPDVRVTTCDYEVQCTPAELRRLADRDDAAPLVHCYYDIETTGLDARAAEVIQVSLVFKRGEEKKRCLVGVRDYAPIPDTHVYAVACEADLLRCVARLVVEEDPDSLVAYNGVNFDNPFLAERAKACGVELHLARFALRPSRLRELRLNSSGMGDNLLRYFDAPGRSNYDWYVKLKRDLPQEDSYKLDYMAHKFCGAAKVELASGLKWRRLPATAERAPAHELAGAEAEALRARLAAAAGGACVALTQEEWRAVALPTPLCEHHWVRAGGACYAPANTKHRAIADLHDGTAADRARLGYYCVEDSDLLDRLDGARAMMVEIYQFAGVFGVAPEWIYFRGQQVRFVSVLLRKVRVAETTPLLLNRPPDGFRGEDRAGFDGAVVNDPMRGFHTTPVGTLDWKSLYPAIMISANLCHSTCVLDPALHAADGVTRYAIAPDYTTHFVAERVHRGILPQILEELATERTRAKGLVKAAAARGDTAMARVYDGRQLAVKMAMNSMYGACGTSVDAGAKLPCLDISATVTFLGREAMGHKKRLLAAAFPGIRVVYGDTDSVMIQFPDVTDVQECGAKCVAAADMVTTYFRADLNMRAMELEFEKIFCPYLLEGKKRYMGLKFEMDGGGVMRCKGIDAKGVETERKDTLPYLKVIMREVRDALMYRKDADEAVACFRARMDALVRGEVPMELLTLRKNLSGKVEHKTETIVQAKVNAKRRAREAGSEAQVNEQVEYVIVNGHKGAKTTQLAEDPEYAKEHGLKLNTKWYFEHCIRGAMKKMLEYLPSIDYAALAAEYSQRLDSVRLNVNSDALRMMLGTAPSSSASSYAPQAPDKRKRK